MTESESLDAFSDAVNGELEYRGITQAEFGASVAEAEGRERPYTQSNVTDWLARHRGLRPSLVFAMERALELPAGALSYLLGYLPLAAVPTFTVAEALARDTRLSPSQRRMILVTIEALASDGES